jgi:hypothetical protein
MIYVLSIEKYWSPNSLSWLVRIFKCIAAKFLWNMASYFYLIKSIMYGIWNKIYQSNNVYFLDVDMWGSEWCQWCSDQHGASERSVQCPLIFWVTLQPVGDLLPFSTPSVRFPNIAGVCQIRCLFSLTKHSCLFIQLGGC